MNAIKQRNYEYRIYRNKLGSSYRIPKDLLPVIVLALLTKTEKLTDPAIWQKCRNDTIYSAPNQLFTLPNRRSMFNSKSLDKVIAENSSENFLL